MTKFISVQHTYQGVEIALFNDSRMVEKVFDDKKRASKNFVAMVSSLLGKHNCSIGDLSFIAANQGPGPFTTLRVVISSVNGLAFGAKKPLIGVDGLDAILSEFSNNSCAITAVLLDAFSSDVYFAFQHVDFVDVPKGYKNISVLLHELKSLSNEEDVYFVGNGSSKYKDEIVSLFADKAVFTDPIAQQSSIECVGKMAFQKWEQSEGLTDQLFPVYLKDIRIKKTVPSSF